MATAQSVLNFLKGFKKSTKEAVAKTATGAASAVLGLVKGTAGIVEKISQPIRPAGQKSYFGAVADAIDVSQDKPKFDAGAVKKFAAETAAKEKVRKAALLPEQRQQEAIDMAINFSPIAGFSKAVKPKVTAAPAKKAVEEITKKGVTLFKETKGAVEKLLKIDPKDPIAIADEPRLFKRIGEGFRSGRLTVDDVPVLKQYGFSAQEAADVFEQGATTSGRILKQLSDISKQLGKKFPELKAPVTPPTFFDKITSLPRKAINIWRASLTSQLATAVRNVATFGERYFFDVVDDAMTGVYETMRGTKTPRQAFAPMIEDVLAIGRQFTPSKREAFNKLLDQLPLTKAKVFNTPVGDVALGQKYANVINVFNRTQEYFARTMVMDAKIAGELGRLGMPLKNLKPSAIPPEVLNRAVDRALEMTYAAYPKGKLGKAFVQTMNNPILAAISYPFPRYLTNAVRTIWEFSPMGITKFLNPKYVKMLASSEPREAVKIINRAAIGSTMMAAGWWIRNSQHAGEKWYEVKVGNKTLDARPFGPLLPVYLFLGELLKTDGKSFGPKDWAEGMLGINRMAGTTLFVTSMLAGQEDWRGFKKSAQRFVGEFLGGYTVPFRTFKDLLGGLVDEETISRYKKEDPLIAPMLDNIPFAGRYALPEAPSPTRDEPLRRESTVLRQLTGISVKTKNLLETEVDRLGLKAQQIYPSTGNAKIDRLITAKMGKAMEKIVLPKVVNSQKYPQMDDVDKKDVMTKIFSEVRTEARKKVLEEEAEALAKEIFAEVKDEDREGKITILRRYKSNGLLTEPVETELKKLLKDTGNQ